MDALTPDVHDYLDELPLSVEHEGVRRWLAAHGSAEITEAQRRSQRLQDDFVSLVFATRERLGDLYGSPRTDAEKRREKARIFSGMHAHYARLKARWDGDERYDRWFSNGLNNARLASIVTYHDLVPGFQAMLARHNGDLGAFYREVQALAAQPREQRRVRLHGLEPTQSAKGQGQATRAGPEVH